MAPSNQRLSAVNKSAVAFGDGMGYNMCVRQLCKATNQVPRSAQAEGAKPKGQNYMNRPISEKIRELRKDRGLTQEKLGAMLGVSGQAVSKWESGECAPDIMMLPDLCAIFGISTDALLDAPYPPSLDTCLKNLAAASAKAGGVETAFKAVEACTRGADDRFLHGSAFMGGAGMRVYGKRGFAAVINGNEMLEALAAMSADTVCAVLRPTANAAALGIMTALSGGSSLTEEELAGVCGLDGKELNSALFSLMKLGFCEYDPDGRFAEGPRAYAWYLMLLGVFLSTREGQREVNSVSKSYD